MNSIRPNFPFFPAAPTGETVYSVFSRCIERSGLPDTYIMKELTSQRTITPLLSILPGHLRKMADRIPTGHPWREPTVIVREHTCLPYFVYFDDEINRRGWSQRYIEAEYSHSVAMALGLTLFPCGARPLHPRFCPTCIKEDDNIYGYSCFHREHQLPGVAVCWKHGMQLAQGCANCGPYPIKWMGLSMAGKCNCDRGIIPLPAYTALPNQMEPLHWLARESAYLVNSTGTRHEHIGKTLRDHALKSGLGRRTLIDPFRFADAIEKRFGGAILKWLNIPAYTKGNPSPWVRRLLNPSRMDVKRCSTLHYLLVIGALFDSMEDFERASSVRSDPSPLFKGSAISTSHAKTETPSESLDCKLWTLLQSGNCGLPGIAKRLGVTTHQLIPLLRQEGWRVPLSRQTAKKLGKDKIVAIRMDLRNGAAKINIMRQYGCSAWAITLIELDEPGLNDDFHNGIKNQIRERHRSRLQSYLANKPRATRSDILFDLAGVYDYMINNDKDWFYNLFPERKKPAPAPRKKRVDWVSKDQLMANEAERTFLSMLSMEGKPVQATKTAVLKRIKLLSQYIRTPSNFPLVTRVIENRAESHPEWVKRRLAWAVGEMARDDVPVSVNKLRRVADLPAQTLRLHKDFIIGQTEQQNATIESRSFFT